MAGLSRIISNKNIVQQSEILSEVCAQFSNSEVLKLGSQDHQVSAIHILGVIKKFQ